MSVRFQIERYCGQWRWSLLHQNGCVIAYSDVYTRKSDVKRAIARLQNAEISGAVVVEPGKTR